MGTKYFLYLNTKYMLQMYLNTEYLIFPANVFTYWILNISYKCI